MKKEDLKIIGLSTREILLKLIDFTVTPFFEADPIYRKSVKEYKKEREIDHEKFKQRISYLKKQGYIRTFSENKQKFIELTPTGLKRALKFSIDLIEIKRPKVWDKKWRVVIFDIPEKHKNSRDYLRMKLIELGFIQVQKSVYVFPFQCTDEIAALSLKLFVEKYVTIMISEIIQGEESLLMGFIKNKILNKDDL